MQLIKIEELEETFVLNNEPLKSNSVHVIEGFEPSIYT